MEYLFGEPALRAGRDVRGRKCFAEKAPEFRRHSAASRVSPRFGFCELPDRRSPMGSTSSATIQVRAQGCVRFPVKQKSGPAFRAQGPVRARSASKGESRKTPALAVPARILDREQGHGTAPISLSVAPISNSVRRPRSMHSPVLYCPESKGKNANSDDSQMRLPTIRNARYAYGAFRSVVCVRSDCLSL